MSDGETLLRPETGVELTFLETFESGLRGQVLLSDHPEYDEARRVWNGMIDRRPALIVRCAGVADVVRCVNFARDNGLLVSVRGGGHNVAGTAVCDGGIVIDLSRMKGMQVDPARGTARAQAGLCWGEFDHETQAFGLASTGGHVTTTGIAGLTLGGGIGWLMRKHGLTVDNLLSADVVTAEGRLLRAAPDENPDLFWALRGGGGNFGVVTSFEYRLHPVATVLSGMLLYPAAQAVEALRFYRDMLDTLPEETTTVAALITAPPAPFLPESLRGASLLAIVVCHPGSQDEGERALRPLRAFGPPMVDTIGPASYLHHQRIVEETAPARFRNYWKAGYMDALSDRVIEAVCESALRAPSPRSLILLVQMGGAVERVGPEETPFPHRGAQFNVSFNAMWAEPDEDARNIEWAQVGYTAVLPHLNGGIYVNFLGNDGDSLVRAAYGDRNYARLVDVKDRYDPANLFRMNQNIRPSA